MWCSRLEVGGLSLFCRFAHCVLYMLGYLIFSYLTMCMVFSLLERVCSSVLARRFSHCMLRPSIVSSGATGVTVFTSRGNLVLLAAVSM